MQILIPLLALAVGIVAFVVGIKLGQQREKRLTEMIRTEFYQLREAFDEVKSLTAAVEPVQQARLADAIRLGDEAVARVIHVPTGRVRFEGYAPTVKVEPSDLHRK